MIAKINSSDHQVRRLAYRSAQQLATAAIVVMFLSMMTMTVGILILETAMTPGPTIPEPGYQPGEFVPLGNRETPLDVFQTPVTLFVYPKDATRLAHNLEQDVALHGGWTIANYNNRDLIFAIPGEYIDRIRPLIEASGVAPVGTTYQRWVSSVAAYPDPSIDGAKTNTTISVHLRFPFAANPATLPTALITSVLIGAAFLTLIVCVVVCQATE